jgi:PEP-CTERM motif
MHNGSLFQTAHFAKLAVAGIVLAAASTMSAESVTIAQDSGAAIGNFQSPGSTANVGYTIQTSDDGTNFYVTLISTPVGNTNTALPFANLYFDTIASTANTGSNLGFEFGPSGPQDAFDPSTSVKYSLVGTGVTSSITTSGDVTTADIVIPNSFFLTDPDAMGFTTTPPGTLVSLHLSQSFSYSVVGGSGNYQAPDELGSAIVGAAVPEPASMGLFGFGLCALAGLQRLRRKNAAN